MGTKLNPGKFDCYAAAMPDEEMFVLLGRDRLGAGLTNLWALIRAGNFQEARIAFDELIRTSAGYVLEPDQDGPVEAIECAIAMAIYRDGREKAKERVAEIDAMFEKADGWGSWMVMAANEREALANRYGWEHKNQARTGGGGRTN